jgi:hypothetical protein
MIRPVMCLAAEGVVRDVQTNNISIYNILEGLTAEGFPFFVQRLTFFALWERAANDPEQMQGRFTVAIADKEIFTKSMTVNFQGQLKVRNIISVQGLLIPQPGQLSFSLKLDAASSPTASCIVEVNAVASAVQADAAPSPQG